MANAPCRLGFAIGVRLTRLSLRTAGFRRTIGFLRRLPKPFAARRVPVEAAISWSETIRVVGGRPYGATCLDRSVFLWFLLLQRGLDATIRIGVTFESGDLDGHAWVELDGAVVNDDADVVDRFAVFDEDPTRIVFS